MNEKGQTSPFSIFRQPPQTSPAFPLVTKKPYARLFNTLPAGAPNGLKDEAKEMTSSFEALDLACSPSHGAYDWPLKSRGTYKGNKELHKYKSIPFSKQCDTNGPSGNKAPFSVNNSQTLSPFFAFGQTHSEDTSARGASPAAVGGEPNTKVEGKLRPLLTKGGLSRNTRHFKQADKGSLYWVAEDEDVVMETVGNAAPRTTNTWLLQKEKAEVTEPPERRSWFSSICKRSLSPFKSRNESKDKPLFDKEPLFFEPQAPSLFQTSSHLGKGNGLKSTEGFFKPSTPYATAATSEVGADLLQAKGGSHLSTHKHDSTHKGTGELPTLQPPKQSLPQTCQKDVFFSNSSAASTNGSKEGLHTSLGSSAVLPSAVKVPPVSAHFSHKAAGTTLNTAYVSPEEQTMRLYPYNKTMTTSEERPSAIVMFADGANHLIRVFLNLALVLALLTSCYYAYASISKDIQSRLAIEYAKLFEEVMDCRKQYRDNNCSVMPRLPIMEIPCTEFERCMSQDPALHTKRSHLSVKLFAEIINAFVEQLEWRTISILSLLFVVLFVGSNWALSVGSGSKVSTAFPNLYYPHAVPNTKKITTASHSFYFPPIPNDGSGDYTKTLQMDNGSVIAYPYATSSTQPS